ncbi:MAG: ribonuclease J [Candidatus Fermentithermobacillus carboniphilus]|uniref:Ribonuclease J n=1 Tax=Candidatus Fermentithermobacillus carboniphilus TaxID=3085328 RepID=A0AAT9LEP1_9FIRM|nr:MAG: ribonuclease J [Candidatus Fermentithermobacillus carboniphilus]
MTKEIRLIALGGLGEIGKNLMVLESGPDAIAIDCGLAFPKEDMPGVDLVIPDISYLVERKDRLRGIVLTHGHEDHVGSLPFVLSQVNVPVYGTKLTLGLARRKMDENFEGEFDFRVVSPRDVVDFGSIKVEFVRVTHSVSDSVGLIIYTPCGTIVCTGDFKLDQTPVDGETTDYHRFAEVGERGVLALLSDSTHADRPGFTPSERVVGENLSQVFYQAKGRIIVTTFASNVPRIQQVIDAAYKYGRKVCVVGRSMEAVVEAAMNMGFLRVPLGTLIDVDDINKYPLSKLVILSTGSQGEPLSALARMSLGDHRKVEIVEGDLVIMAASPVPGNETMVSRVVDNLFRRGATVIYTPESGVHVSGHASQEELKLMLNLTRPKFFIPIHGEYRHLVIHAQLAVATGVPPSNVLIGENGTIFRLTPDRGEILGMIQTKDIFVDGLGVGDVGDVILKERQSLGEAGAVFISCAVSGATGNLVSEPEVKSAGFAAKSRGSALMTQVIERAKEYFSVLPREALTRKDQVEEELSSIIQRMFKNETGRRPVVVCTVNLL